MHNNEMLNGNLDERQIAADEVKEFLKSLKTEDTSMNDETSMT